MKMKLGLILEYGWGVPEYSNISNWLRKIFQSANTHSIADHYVRWNERQLKHRLSQHGYCGDISDTNLWLWISLRIKEKSTPSPQPRFGHAKDDQAVSSWKFLFRELSSWKVLQFFSGAALGESATHCNSDILTIHKKKLRIDSDFRISLLWFFYFRICWPIELPAWCYSRQG